MQHEMEQERLKLVQDKERLLKQLDIVTSNIALLDKFSENGNQEPTPPLIKAAPQVMETMKRFTRRELLDRITQEFPGLHFSEHSLSKPISRAIASGVVRIIQPNIGSKTQAVYEWVKE
jgi:hypothetical protein